MKQTYIVYVHNLSNDAYYQLYYDVADEYQAITNALYDINEFPKEVIHSVHKL